MKFILTKFTTGEEFEVTRECVDRVRGDITIKNYIKRVEETGEPVRTYFEGDYDLKVAK